MHEMMVTNFQSMAKNQSILVGCHLSFKMDSEVYVYMKNYSHFKQAEAMFSYYLNPFNLVHIIIIAILISHHIYLQLFSEDPLNLRIFFF